MKNPEPHLDNINPILKLLNAGKLNDALSMSSQLVINFPKSTILFNIIGASNAGLMKYDDAIASYKQAIKNNPNYADSYYNLGNIFKDLGVFDEAIDCYKKALSINPENANTLNNLGNVLNNQGKLDDAIDSYNRALLINPENANTLNNLGNAFSNKGDLDGAIDCYNKALLIKPDNPNTLNNLGIALSNKGNVDEAIDSYKKAININPKYKKAQLNLIGLLTTCLPNQEEANSIVLVNEKIRNINLKDNDSLLITDEQVISLFSQFETYMSDFDLDLTTNYNQAYRRSTKYLNCKRHKSIFNEYNVIPEFCFGCYKVQVEPKSLIELVKLLIVFDQLKLDENNTRKCLIELRPDVSGFYKGLIYCSGLEEANQIAIYLNRILAQRIRFDLKCNIKRGCSEFYNSYPKYQEINNSEPQPLNFNEDWKDLEINHDKSKTFLAEETRRQSISGLNLNDFLIIRRWIDYAKGIGDQTETLFKKNDIHYNQVHKVAKKRLDNFKL